MLFQVFPFNSNVNATLQCKYNTQRILTPKYMNRPFPSCCLPRFRSESWCSTIVRKMSLICIRMGNSFPFQWLCTRTRFESEACSNSEIGYWYNIDYELADLVCCLFLPHNLVLKYRHFSDADEDNLIPDSYSWPMDSCLHLTKTKNK